MEEVDTDYWKDAGKRKSWDGLVAGEIRPSTPYLLTLEAIQRYCLSVGDRNPLYFDEEYAKKSRYGGLIAPPYIHTLLLLACTPMTDMMRTPGTINASQFWSYNVPARPGDTVTLHARCLDKFIKGDRLFAVHDNVFYNDRNEIICAGRGWTVRPA